LKVSGIKVWNKELNTAMMDTLSMCSIISIPTTVISHLENKTYITMLNYGAYILSDCAIYLAHTQNSRYRKCSMFVPHKKLLHEPL
jgi:hypothetical protein